MYQIMYGTLVRNLEESLDEKLSSLMQTVMQLGNQTQRPVFAWSAYIYAFYTLYFYSNLRQAEAVLFIPQDGSYQSLWLLITSLSSHVSLIYPYTNNREPQGSMSLSASQLLQ